MRPPPREPFFFPYPLALLFAGLAAGILIALFNPIRLALTLTLAAVASASALLFLIKRNYRYSTLAVFLAVLCSGATLATIANQRPKENQIKRLIEEGRISSEEAVELVGWLDRPLEYTP